MPSTDSIWLKWRWSLLLPFLGGCGALSGLLYGVAQWLLNSADGLSSAATKGLISGAGMTMMWTALAVIARFVARRR